MVDPGFSAQQISRESSMSKQLCDPHSLLFSEYLGSFPRVRKVARVWHWPLTSIYF